MSNKIFLIQILIRIEKQKQKIILNLLNKNLMINFKGNRTININKILER